MWTDTTLKAMQPRSGRYRRSENLNRRGIGRLVVEVQSDGVKTFFFQFFRNHDGKSQRVLIRIGRYKQAAKSLGGFTLSEARDRAIELSDLVKRGQDPKTHREEERRQAEARRRQLEAEKRQGTFAQLLDSYLASMVANGRRSHVSVATSLNTYVRRPFPQLMNRKAVQIEADDIRIILSRMLDLKVTTHTNRVRSYLHAAFQHGLEQDNNPRSYTPDGVRFNLKYNPVASIPKQADYERVGEHMISETDIPTIWCELPKIAPLAGAVFKLAFATGGQRVGELLRIPKTDIDLKEELLVINRTISKNSLDHVVPLNSIALKIVAELLEFTNDCQFLFPAKRGRRYATDAPTMSSSIDRMIRDFCEAQNDVQKFTPRDIRRTVKTEMGRAGIDKILRDRIQNHALQDVSTKHYDRYDYLPEKRAALKVWNDCLELIIQPQKNVTRMKRKIA